MFERQLIALGYPDTSATFSDDSSFRELVLWLETNHINCLAENERGKLKVQGDTWETSFDEYLTTLHSPYNATCNRNSLISWLLGRAVRQEFSTNAEELKTLTAENWQSLASSENPLARMDYDSEAFVQLSQSLATLLSLPPYSDHKEVLNAACMLVFDRLKATSGSTKSSAAAKRSKTSSVPANAASFPLQSTPLGFESNDYVLNDLAKILRLQHISELRELQTVIDEAIVTVQKITANPKTDTKLGKHGF